jgi:hypothetical protein
MKILVIIMMIINKEVFSILAARGASAQGK